MPEKSVREMSKLERKHYSLESRVFHAAVFSAIALGLVALIVGLGLYTYALVGQYVGDAFSLSKSAAAIMNQATDAKALAADVMSVYRSLSEEEREGSRTDAYRSNYDEITSREDYLTLRILLRDFLDSSDMNDIYFAVYDRDTSSLIYIVDPDEREGHICYPGDWESVSEKELETFLSWDGTGKLHYFSKRDNYAWLCTAGVPLTDDTDEIACFVLADVSLSEVAAGMKNFFLQYLIAMTVATFLLAYFLTKRMKRTLVKPINAIAEAAQSYVKDKRAGVADTEHFAMLNIRTGDEVENLSLVMADMERDLSEYVENLTKVTAEKQRVSTELNMATQIQEGMLPNIYPAFPDRPEFDIYASMDPAREVGGDFYDYFLVDDNHLCMVMADVSGKGVPAALFMMASKIILQNNAMMGKSPAQVLTDTNAAICSNNRMEMFVTVWLGILEISTGKLTAANAGHEYPALKAPDGKFELFKDKHGFVIGGMDGIKYKEYEMTLRPGSKLFLYTDGVPEATDANDNLFATDRMLTALNESPDATPKEILRNVRRAVDSFVKDAEQFDDLTMLCLEYKEKAND